jgi:4-amino-4-deoxy-L-arabinose transferase-like glycosyltransferase
MSPHAPDGPSHGLMLPANASADGPDALDACAAVTLLVVGTLSWTALTLAEFGAFSRPVFIVAAILVAAALAAWLRPIGGWIRRTPDTWSFRWLALLLLASSTMVRHLPDPAVGGADENVYFHLGAIIDTRGGLAVTDPVLASTPSTEWPALFSREIHWPQLLNRFEGGVQAQDGNPRLRPNFFHLTPAWIAAVTALAGTHAAVYAVPLVACLVPLVLFLLARRLISVPAAMAASALLAVNPGFVWAGRLPLSEILAAYLVVSGLAFAVLWLSSGNRAAGSLAGLAIGLAALDRIDALLLIVPVIAVLLLVEWRAGRRIASVAVPLVVLTTHCVVHALTVSRPYTQRLFRYLAHDRHLASLVAIAVAGVLITVAVLVARHVRWRPPAGWLRNAGTAMVVAVIGWLAIRVGPGIGSNHLTVLLTPPGLVLALAGLLVASRSSDRAVWLTIAVVAISAVVFVEAPRDFAGLPRVFRRDVPTLVPLMALFQARVLFPAGAGRLQRLAAVVLLVALTGLQANRLQTIYRGGTESTGAREAVEGVAALLPPDALVIADSREADHLDLALDAAGRPTVGPRRRGDAAMALRALADRALAANRPVAFLTTAVDEPLRIGTLAGLSFAPAGRASFRVPRDGTIWPAPSETRPVELSLYRVSARAPLPWRPGLGTDDVGAVMGGWHAPETFMRQRGRWTGPAATMQLPAFDCAANSPPSLGAIRFASIRPSAMAQPHVTVSIERQEVLRTAPQDSGFHVYLFRLSDGLVHDICRSAATLTISADSFIPRRDAGLRDERELGIAVAWLELGTLPSTVPHE